MARVPSALRALARRRANDTCEYCRMPQSHAEHLPQNCICYADPSGAGDINELIRGNYKVAAADNPIRSGIAAVSARLEDGSLRMLEGSKAVERALRV